MAAKVGRVTYRGYRVGERWEVVVKRLGEPSRPLDLPVHPGEWALRILTDYLGDERRAEELHAGVAALTIHRFTEDWQLSDSDIDDAIRDVELLNLQWRATLARN